MNCGVFSSDQMLNVLNERALNLTQSAIIKQANAIDDDNLHNGIHIWASWDRILKLYFNINYDVGVKRLLLLYVKIYGKKIKYL